MTATTTQKTAPVTVTRGLKNLENVAFLSQSDTNVRKQIVAQSIHWIQGTFKQRTQPSLPPILSQEYVETKPFNGYKSASLFADGRISMVNPDRPDMGVHMVWQGRACDDCPLDPIELIAHLYNADFQFTRLDLAVDAFNYKLRPQRATKELALGRCKTKAKLSLTYSDPQDPRYTQDVGVPSSEIYLCIYDKAAEQHIDGDWTRVELKTRRSRANKAAWEVVHNTDFRGLVLAYADFPQWSQWRKVMATTPVKLQKQQAIGNTEKWLLDACAPALARTIFLSKREDGEINLEFYEKFKDEVMHRLEQLSDKRQTVA